MYPGIKEENKNLSRKKSTVYYGLYDITNPGDKKLIMEDKRILLLEDDRIVKVMERDLGEYQPLLNRIKQTYEDLGLGDFSNQIFEQVKSGNTQEIMKKLDGKIDREIKRVGITNDILKANLKNGSLRPFEDFGRTVRGFLAHSPKRNTMELDFPRLNINHISFRSGIFYFSNEDQENILEQSCRIYIETEEEHRLYKNLQAFIGAYEILKSNLDEIEVQVLDGVRSVSKQFLTLKDEKLSIIPKSIRHAIGEKQRLEDIRQRQMRNAERLSKR